jgi:hypothetical protein
VVHFNLLSFVEWLDAKVKEYSRIIRLVCLSVCLSVCLLCRLSRSFVQRQRSQEPLWKTTMHHWTHYPHKYVQLLVAKMGGGGGVRGDNIASLTYASRKLKRLIIISAPIYADNWTCSTDILWQQQQKLWRGCFNRLLIGIGSDANKQNIDRSIDWSEIKFTAMWDLNGSPVRRLINAGYINRANFRRTDLKTHFSTSSSANDDNDLENQNLIPSRTSRAGAIRFKVLFSRFPEWKLSIQK